MKKFPAFIIFAVFVTACGPIIPGAGSGVSTPVEITAELITVVAETPGPPPTAGSSPTPVPATPIPTLPAPSLSPSELKYKILDQFPDFFFCDPDFYPIARDDEMSLAQQRFAELQANQEEFQAILRHNDLAGTTTFTNDQKLTIYREHKRLNAIFFELTGNKYRFQIQTGAEGQQGSVITGTIDANSSIEIQKQESSFPSCPICLAAGTLIDTPNGAVAVERLEIGDPVWTMNEAGQRVPGKILKLGSVRVPSSHEVVHLLLSDGRELYASPGHPSSEGKVLGNLQEGELLDGAYVIQIERFLYDGAMTYDLLPSGDTGFYWANRILMESTLSDK